MSGGAPIAVGQEGQNKLIDRAIGDVPAKRGKVWEEALGQS